MNNNLGPAAGVRIHYGVRAAAVHRAGRLGPRPGWWGVRIEFCLFAGRPLLYRKTINLAPCFASLAVGVVHKVYLLVLHQEGTRCPRGGKLFLRDAVFGFCLGQCVRIQTLNQHPSEVSSQDPISSQGHGGH